MTQKVKDLVTQITTMLSALLLFFGTVGIRYDWFNLDSINAFGVLLTALILLGATLWGIYTNTFYQWKAFRIAKEKEQQRLKEDREKNKGKL